MTERLNRDPTYDVGRRIITGVKGPHSGDPVIQQYDAELDRNDPMDPMTAGHGDNFVVPQTAAAIQDANLAQAMGLSTDQADRPAEGISSQPIDMNMANDWADEPTKGGIQYGPRNTGDSTAGGDY